MALSNWIILDVSSAAIPNAADYLDPPASRKAPGSYKKPDSIAQWQQDDYTDDLKRAALDLDLARVTGIAFFGCDMNEPVVELARTEDDERAILEIVAMWASRPFTAPSFLTFSGNRYDLPLLENRARWRGVKFPTLDLSRFKTLHRDIYERDITNYGARLGHPLRWYVRRHGWTDCAKPLTGEEESQVPVSGRWDDLAASLRGDVMATYRLAVWLGVIEPVKALVEEPLL